MSDQYEREAAKAAINTLERELYHARQQRDGWADECERSMRLLNDALDSCEEAIKQRDTYAAALREIMQNEESMHRMGYNPYLIANAALKGGQHD